MAEFLAGKKLSAAALNAEVKKIVARGERATTSTGVTSSTDIGVLRLDDIPVLAGRLYRITVTGMHFDTTVANDVGRARIRYTTDGSTPTVSSNVLDGSTAYALMANASWPETRVIGTTYTPASDETLSLLLCISRPAGSGSVTLFADAANALEITMVHERVDPGDSGTDI